MAWIIAGVVAMAGTIVLFKLSQSPQNNTSDRTQQPKAKTTTRV